MDCEAGVIGTFVTLIGAAGEVVDVEFKDDTFVFVVVVFVVFVVVGGDASALAVSDAGRRRRKAGI